MPVNRVFKGRQSSHLLLICLVYASYGLSAQNLVSNGSFENFTQCPGSFSEAKHEFRVLDWYSANTGTPDHFHSCSDGEASVPYNWAGVSDAFEGHGYAGIYMWM